MKRQLIVTDLDGTLLNANHEIDPFDRDWIDWFQKNNGLFTVATGRMNASVRLLLEQFDVTLPIITYNGAQIYLPTENKLLYEKSFQPSKLMLEQLVILARTFAEVLFFSNDHVYTITRGKQIEAFEKKEKVICTVVAAEQIPLNVTKMIIMSEEIPLLTQFEKKLIRLFPSANIVYSEPNYLEILPEGVSKGAALNWLKEDFSLQDRHTAAFGNHLNDMPLLQAADIGVAVNNADKRLLRVADDVSSYTNNEGAVGHYIEQLFAQVDQKRGRALSEYIT